MRLVFLGSDAIALPALEYLRGAPEVELVGVISQPDRPAGRGRHLHANPVAAWARAQAVTLRQPARLSVEDLEWLRAEQVDLALVMAYGHILRNDFLETPPRGVWNLHGSLLPAYRGASPVETALAVGDTMTGVCLMRVVAALDAGPVADREEVPILPTDTGVVLRGRLGQACVPLLARNLVALGDGSIKTQPQNDARASYTRKLTKADAQLDFAQPAADLERRIRALQPWPGAVVEHKEVALKIGGVTVLTQAATGVPGAIVAVGAAGVDVATGAGILRLLTLQRPGGRMLAAADFLRGYALEVGEQLPGHPLTPLVSPRPFPRPARLAAPPA